MQLASASLCIIYGALLFFSFDLVFPSLLASSSIVVTGSAAHVTTKVRSTNVWHTASRVRSRRCRLCFHGGRCWCSLLKFQDKIRQKKAQEVDGTWTDDKPGKQARAHESRSCRSRTPEAGGQCMACHGICHSWSVSGLAACTQNCLVCTDTPRLSPLSSPLPPQVMPPLPLLPPCSCVPHGAICHDTAVCADLFLFMYTTAKIIMMLRRYAAVSVCCCGAMCSMSCEGCFKTWFSYAIC